jgi:hypothetical protein
MTYRARIKEQSRQRCTIAVGFLKTAPNASCWIMCGTLSHIDHQIKNPIL